MNIDWSTSFIVFGTGDSWLTALVKMNIDKAAWLIIRGRFGWHWYLLTADEARHLFDLLPGGFWRSKIGDTLSIPPFQRAYGSARLPWRIVPGGVGHLRMRNGRMIRFDHGRPAAVGVMADALVGANGQSIQSDVRDAAAPVVLAGASAGASPRVLLSALRLNPAAVFGWLLRAGMTDELAYMGAPDAAFPPAADDEGTTPMRFPSIEPQGPVTPGQDIVLVVDLGREETSTTFGAVALFAGADDWELLDVDAILQSPAIDFDNGGACRLTVRRNAATIAASIVGHVDADVAPGSTIEVKARFLLETRFCGSAVRHMVVAAPAPVPLPALRDAQAPAVQLDRQAQAPDLTVFITLFDADQPGKLHWRMVTAPFPGRPPKMDGAINLGQETAREAGRLFKEFANLERRQHSGRIEGFGETLWQRAPAEFRALYWAMHDHNPQRTLTIQFISDDPHLPWELMVPWREGEPGHGALAKRHLVARWISSWQGYMTNRLPPGNLVAIAPRYASANLAVPSAQVATDSLVKRFAAQRVEGTRAHMLELLEARRGNAVALVYFTGHGAFTPDAADASLIKLEDGTLSASEVGQQKNQLGKRDRTVFFLNACEVGATSNVLGSVGGWADAFLSREFGGFIAPLWAIDEEDAGMVTDYVLPLIVEKRISIAAALKELRNEYGDVSPTFHSYLYFGDVTARLGEMRRSQA